MYERLHANYIKISVQKAKAKTEIISNVAFTFCVYNNNSHNLIYSLSVMKYCTTPP